MELHNEPIENEQDARRLAEEVLDLDVNVITRVEEYEPGWVYYWDSRQHQETGDILDALAGNAPVLVDRSDGMVYFTGTARPVAEYIRRYMERDSNDDESWHP